MMRKRPEGEPASIGAKIKSPKVTEIISREPGPDFYKMHGPTRHWVVTKFSPEEVPWWLKGYGK